MAEKTTTFRS